MCCRLWGNVSVACLQKGAGSLQAAGAATACRRLLPAAPEKPLPATGTSAARTVFKSMSQKYPWKHISSISKAFLENCLPFHGKHLYMCVHRHTQGYWHLHAHVYLQVSSHIYGGSLQVMSAKSLGGELFAWKTARGACSPLDRTLDYSGSTECVVTYIKTYMYYI